MDEQKKAQDMVGRFTGRAVETMTAWADANQHVLHQLAELSAATAKEGVRLYGELQQGALEALRSSQAAAIRWQGALFDDRPDPVQVCEKALTSGADGVERAIKLLEGQARTIGRSAERLQASAEQAGKGIQETYAAVVEKMKDVYSRN